MPKKESEQLFYEHPTAGPLPLVDHPDKPGRVVAYLSGRAVYETDRTSVQTIPEPEPKDADPTDEQEASSESDQRSIKGRDQGRS